MDWLELDKQIKVNQNLLHGVKENQNNDAERKELLKIAKIQYHTTAEQGFIAIPQVAVTNIVTDSLNMFGGSRDNERMRAYSDKQNETNELDDGYETTQNIYGSLAYMMIPGADAIKDLMTLDSLTIEALPGIFKKVAQVYNFISGTVGTGIAIWTMKQLVLFFPVLALSLASLMVIGWYFASVFIYFLISPFIIIYAMSQNQTESIKGFLIKGVALAFKPILIILSVVVAILVINLFQDLSIMIYNSNFSLLIDLANNNGGTGLSWFFMFLGGVLEVGVSVIATLSAFYLVFKGDDIFLGMFGFKESGIDVKEVVGGSIESKTGKYSNAGV